MDRKHADRATRRMACGLAAVLLSAAVAQPAQASESGASVYLLGTGGPGAALLPPVKGVFLANTLYYYDGSADAGRQFEIGGNIVSGLRAKIVANFASVLWTPSTNFLGWTVALGATMPVGYPQVDVSAIIVGPRGNAFNLSRSDSEFVPGDPLVSGALGWKYGKLSVTASTLVNIPAGGYRDGRLANLAFHRWAGDTSLAATWHDDKSGWDLSSKAGFTFNGTNQATDYTTGTEFHVEGAVEKTFSPAFSLGAQAYHFDQVTGDSGSGAILGSFKGRVTGVGGTAAYNFKIAGKIPATLRLHGISEFDARNRLEGHSIWLDFTMPLAVTLPPGAAAP